MKDVRNYIILVLAILFYFKGCDSCNAPNEDKVTKSDTSAWHVADTKTHIDTIPFHDTVTHHVSIPVVIPIYDTIKGTFKYANPYNDSLISGTIETTIKDSKILEQNLLYKPKFPKYINRTDSVWLERTITNTIIERKANLTAGILLTGSKTSFGFSPMAGIKFKNGKAIQLGYDLINRNYQLSLSLPIKLK